MLAAFRRANRAELLHWANANLQRPENPCNPTCLLTFWTRPESWFIGAKGSC